MKNESNQQTNDKFSLTEINEFSNLRHKLHRTNEEKERMSFLMLKYKQFRCFLW